MCSHDGQSAHQESLDEHCTSVRRQCVAAAPRTRGGGGGGSYRIERVDSSSWRIVDDSVAPQKSEHVVASIEEIDESGVTESWLQPLPLAAHYLAPEMILVDLDLWQRRVNAAEPPLPIPHLPPTGPQKTV